MSFRFVHAADLHLDTPYQGIGQIAPRIQEALRDASLQSLDNLVDLAIDRQASFLVLAGDIYDGAIRGVRAQLRFRRSLERLSERNIQTFVVHGNHDPLEGGWTAIREWPPGVTIFGSASVEAAPVSQDGIQIAIVHGLSYRTRDVIDNLSLLYHRGEDSGVHIGILHCSIGDDPDHAAYSPCSLEDLSRGRMDYWALGHIHKRQILNRGNPWIAYSGNTQGRSPKPSETGTKGALVVAVDGSAVQEPEFVAIDCVRFVKAEVDVGEARDLPSLQHLLIDVADDLRVEHGGRGIVLRVVLTGRGSVHPLLAHPGTIDGLRRDLREAAAEMEPFLWWDTIRDETRPNLDRSLIEQRDDFLAELLRDGKTLRDTPEALAIFARERFRVLQRGPLARFAEDICDSKLIDLFEEAGILVIDLLDTGGDG